MIESKGGIIPFVTLRCTTSNNRTLECPSLRRAAGPPHPLRPVNRLKCCRACAVMPVTEIVCVRLCHVVERVSSTRSLTRPPP